MKKFPKVLYAAWKEESTQNEFLSTSESPLELSEPDEAVQAGRYELVEVVTLRNTTTVEGAKRKKKGVNR